MSSWFAKQLSRFGMAGSQAEELASAAPPSDPIAILLVDDTPANIQVLMETLKPLGHKLLAAKDGEAALTIAKRSHPAIILLDVMMPGIDGFEVCRRLKEDPELAQAAVIFCSALDDTAAKVKGLQLGAVDFVTKPFEPEEVVARVSTHLAVQLLARSLAARNRALARELAVAQAEKNDALRRLDWAMAGNSPALRQLKAQIASVAEGDEPVLLRSQPSCGAEVVARAIHAASPRREQPFIVVDGLRFAVGASAADVLPFAKGGSSASRFNLADGGTLFIDHIDRIQKSVLDELSERINEMAAARQAGKKPSPDTRLIAVTDKEGGAVLPEQVSVALRMVMHAQEVHLPTVAARREDIAALIEAVMHRQAKALGQTLSGIESESLQKMQAYEWPGNLRELEDVVVRSVAAAPATGKVRVDPALLQSGKPLGSYRLLRRLGAGGFGEVWEARHQLLARPAAVKLILSSGAADPERMERFKREAAATAHLASPHTVTLYDFGVSETGQFYYVMELLTGIDLEHLLRDYGALPPERLAHFLVHACRSLAEAHRMGMVHRDIKPSNLFACRLGMEVDVLKVLDFGLVRRQEEGGQGQLTQDDAVLGTPTYMAPEAATDGGNIDGRTDVYSLAATAWTLATGRELFPGPTVMSIILGHVNKPPTPLLQAAPKTPQALADVIMAGLAKAPADRPTAMEMTKALLASGLPQAWDEEARQNWWQHNDPMAATPTPASGSLPPDVPTQNFHK